MRAVGALAIALALSGCADLADIDREICGNGLIEPGEDCDPGNVDHVLCTSSCQIRCSSDDDCKQLGEGYEAHACGADSLCHAPAGTFRDPIEYTTAVDSFAITDLDGDLVNEIVVHTSTTIDVLAVDADGIGLSSSIATPIARNRASYAHLDDGDSLDVTLPTNDGIVAYTSVYGRPAPHPFPSAVGGMGVPVKVYMSENDHLVAIGLVTGVQTFGLFLLYVGQGEPTPRGFAPLCGATAADVARDDISIYEVADQLVVAATIRPPGALPRLCVLHAQPTVDGPYQITNITPNLASAPRSAPVLAGLPGACPSLIVRTIDGSLRELAAAATTPCRLVPGRSLVGAQLQSEPVAWFPVTRALQPTVLGLVMSTGLYEVPAAPSNVLEPLQISERAWTTAMFTDYDRDGLTDVVAGERGARDLDVLDSVDGGMAFRRVRVPTSGLVDQIAVGDYDGNERVDIAYAQRNGDAQHELVVAYASTDTFLAGSIVGTYSNVLSMITTDVPDWSDPGGNLVADLAVLFDEGDPQQPQLTLLHGNPLRTMLAFFGPRVPGPPPATGELQFDQFIASVPGRFRGNAHSDILAFQMEVEDLPDGQRTSRFVLWLSDGATGTESTSDVPYATAPESQISNDACVASAGSSAFCMEGARFVAWPHADGARDVVIGVDRFGRAMTIDPAQIIGGQLALTPWQTSLDDRVFAIPLGPFERPRLLGLRVLELGGTRRLAVLFGAPEGQKSHLGSMTLCELGADNVATRDTCKDAAVLARTGSRCTDAAIGTLAGVRPFAAEALEPRVVLLCNTDDPIRTREYGLYELATLDAETATQIGDLGELGTANDAIELAIADLDGDTVDDIVAIDRSRTLPIIRVYLQCTTRDRQGCERLDQRR